MNFAHFGGTLREMKKQKKKGIHMMGNIRNLSFYWTTGDGRIFNDASLLSTQREEKTFAHNK